MAKPGTVIIKTRAAAASNQAVAPVSNIFLHRYIFEGVAGGNCGPARRLQATSSSRRNNYSSCSARDNQNKQVVRLAAGRALFCAR